MIDTTATDLDEMNRAAEINPVVFKCPNKSVARHLALLKLDQSRARFLRAVRDVSKNRPKTGF